MKEMGEKYTTLRIKVDGDSLLSAVEEIREHLNAIDEIARKYHFYDCATAEESALPDDTNKAD